MGRVMRRDEKCREYRRLAVDLLDYVYLCAEKGIVPLRYDANVYNARFTAVDEAKVSRW